MINLYSTASNSTFVMYPDEIPFSASLTPFYRLSLSQSLDNSNSLVTLTRLNTSVSKNKSSVIILQAPSGSGVPSVSGQYQAEFLFCRQFDNRGHFVQHRLIQVAFQLVSVCHGANWWNLAFA